MLFFLHGLRRYRDLHSFPTRRSSDLIAPFFAEWLYTSLTEVTKSEEAESVHLTDFPAVEDAAVDLDRKSTRLNSSHVAISYAVFCLKKKKKQIITRHHWSYYT